MGHDLSMDPVYQRMMAGHAAAEVQPARCVKCHEPVGLRKRDCACTRATQKETETKP